MKIVLIGIQGAGKSTQGNLLSEKLKIPYLSTGHIFRELAKEKTKFGRYVKEVMNAGYLIHGKKTLAVVAEYLKRPEYKDGYIMDGFPRTLSQAEFFKERAEKMKLQRRSQEELSFFIELQNQFLITIEKKERL